MDDFEYGEEPPIHQEKPKDITPPISPQKIETQIQEQPQDQEELPPPKSAAKVINQEEEEVPPSKEQEEDILPPPKVLFIPQSAGSNKPKTASSPFGMNKPDSAKIKSPFVNVSQPTSSWEYFPNPWVIIQIIGFKIPESAERKVATPLIEPEYEIEGGDIDVSEGSETSLLVRLKKAEIELRKGNFIFWLIIKSF